MAEPGPVLVLRALGLGDALTGVPALRGLRRLHPQRPLLLAAPAGIGEWFTGLGLVDGFVPTSGLDDAPPGRDLGQHDAVNLHGRGPQSHALLLAGHPRSLLAFAPPEDSDDGPDRGAGLTTVGSIGDPGDRVPQWRADEHEVLRWCRLVSWAGGPCGPEDLRLDAPPRASAERTEPRTHRRQVGPYVVLHPGAASGSRRWPVDRWSEVARALRRDHDVLLTGGPDERELCGRVATSAGLPACSVTAGALDLPRLTDLVAHAALLVCGDTGVAHVATATGTPSVLLFGPVSPRLWGPAVDRHLHASLWHGDGSGDPHGDDPDPALLRVTPTEVLVAARALLGA
ncbi:MAG TPA: glycosyltransferase family 9 protein [Actinomycetales bacterium]|nr:glycosyltransferase family 9 protein [Actinomycetales bacterium]